MYVGIVIDIVVIFLDSNSQKKKIILKLLYIISFCFLYSRLFCICLLLCFAIVYKCMMYIRFLTKYVTGTCKLF